MERRKFNSIVLGLLATSPQLISCVTKTEAFNSICDQIAANPSNKWELVRSAYNQKPDWINLNNANLNPCPQLVHEAYLDLLSQSNALPSFRQYSEHKLEKLVLDELAMALHCKTEELAFMRNTTEALNNAIMGIPLEAGDEVIISNWDYPHMFAAWKEVEREKKVSLVKVELPALPKSKQELIHAFTSAVSSKTKAILLTEVINFNGVLIPVKEILDELPAHVRYRIVDGAQSFGLLPVNLAEMGCTHYATSFHKWLSAPRGTGCLFVRSDMQAETDNLIQSEFSEKASIKKFRVLGTYNIAAYLAVSNALEFLNCIGVESKFTHLKQLQNYWVEKLGHQHPTFQPYAAVEEIQSGIGIIVVPQSFELSPLISYLQDGKMHISTFHHNGLTCLRISPNVYTKEQDLDAFVERLLAY